MENVSEINNWIGTEQIEENEGHHRFAINYYNGAYAFVCLYFSCENTAYAQLLFLRFVWEEKREM